jgi:hypothetical protein
MLAIRWISAASYRPFASYLLCGPTPSALLLAHLLAVVALWCRLLALQFPGLRLEFALLMMLGGKPLDHSDLTDRTIGCGDSSPSTSS